MTDINVTLVCRAQSRYVFVYRDDQRDQILNLIWKYADDPELDLTCDDAAYATLKIVKALKVRVAT